MVDPALSIKSSYEPGHTKMCIMPYANNKGADRSLSLEDFTVSSHTTSASHILKVGFSRI